MTTNTDALPPLPNVAHLVPPEIRHNQNVINGIHRAMSDYARAALAQRQQVPADALLRLWPAIESAMRGIVFTAERAGEVQADMNAVRAALTAAPSAQRQQVPAEWTMRLDADAAETLKQTIGDDDTVSEITLSLCDGHEGRGLYVWLTEYPEEGSLLLAAAPALTAAPSARTKQEQEKS